MRSAKAMPSINRESVMRGGLNTHCPRLFQSDAALNKVTIELYRFRLLSFTQWVDGRTPAAHISTRRRPSGPPGVLCSTMLAPANGHNAPLHQYKTWVVVIQPSLPARPSRHEPSRSSWRAPSGRDHLAQLLTSREATWPRT